MREIELTQQIQQQQQEKITEVDPDGHKVVHHLRLWASIDDDDVMARCRCGNVSIGERLADVASEWAQHMAEIRMKMELSDDDRRT